MCANEFKHKTVGTELTQAEWEAVGGHVFDSQATGDIAYASSSTQISRLGVGSTGDTLTVASGVPAWNTAVQTDATASRAIDGTVYQNTSGRPLLVSVNFRSNVDDDGSGAIVGNSQVTIHTDTNTPPTTQVAVGGLVIDADPDSTFTTSDYIDGYFQLTFVVLPSSYYKATSSNGGSGAAATLLDWFEWEL